MYPYLISFIYVTWTIIKIWFSTNLSIYIHHILQNISCIRACVSFKNYIKIIQLNFLLFERNIAWVRDFCLSKFLSKNIDIDLFFLLLFEYSLNTTRKLLKKTNFRRHQIIRYQFINYLSIIETNLKTNIFF